jgi:hypothetical protein
MPKKPRKPVDGAALGDALVAHAQAQALDAGRKCHDTLERISRIVSDGPWSLDTLDAVNAELLTIGRGVIRRPADDEVPFAEGVDHPTAFAAFKKALAAFLAHEHADYLDVLEALDEAVNAHQADDRMLPFRELVAHDHGLKRIQRLPEMPPAVANAVYEARGHLGEARRELACGAANLPELASRMHEAAVGYACASRALGRAARELTNAGRQVQPQET